MLNQLRGQSLTDIVENIEVMDLNEDDILEDFRDQDDRDEFNSRYDDKAERYGDPCSNCGCKTWGGDCPNCYDED